MPKACKVTLKITIAIFGGDGENIRLDHLGRLHGRKL